MLLVGCLLTPISYDPTSQETGNPKAGLLSQLSGTMTKGGVGGINLKILRVNGTLGTVEKSTAIPP